MRHPLHPALVHFPIACWSIATGADIAGLWWPAAITLAAAVLIIGLVSALAAMTAGLVELRRIGGQHPASRDVDRHMIWAMSAWGLYAMSLFARLHGARLVPPGMLAMSLSAAGFVCLAIAGWLGGRLVYHHGLGVRAGIG